MVDGLSHLTFIVRDLDRMERLLTTVLGATKVYDSNATSHSLSPERFFMVGGVWLAIMQGEPLPQRSYNHVAFKIEESAFETCRGRVAALGLVIREDRPRIVGEARSLYFYDDDNHLFELHTGTLEQRLQAYGTSQTDCREEA